MIYVGKFMSVVAHIFQAFRFILLGSTILLSVYDINKHCRSIFGHKYLSGNQKLDLNTFDIFSHSKFSDSFDWLLKQNTASYSHIL